MANDGDERAWLPDLRQLTVGRELPLRTLHQSNEQAQLDETAQTEDSFSTTDDGSSIERVLTPSTDSYFPQVLRPPVKELGFMDFFPRGDLTVLYRTATGGIGAVSHLNRDVLAFNFPSLMATWNLAAVGSHLYLPKLDCLSAAPFFRYLYTKSYALRYEDEDIYDEVPTSLLLHCQMFQLGQLYDDASLRTQAYVNILRQFEFGCSCPEKPIDLCAAIAYVYTTIRESQNIKDAIANYCVTRFIDHHLAADDDFQKLTLTHPRVHQDLCRCVISRRFEDAEASMAIMRLNRFGNSIDLPLR